MIKLVVLAVCVAMAAADGYGNAESHINVETYNPWGSSKYEVQNVHPKLVGGQGGGYGSGYGGGYGGGYGKFVGGRAKVYVQAQGSGGYGRGDKYGSGYGGGYDGYDGGYGGYGDGYSYKYNFDAGRGSGYGGSGYRSGYDY